MILQKPDIWEKTGSLVMKGISESRMLLKESIDILVFLHESSNQGKATLILRLLIPCGQLCYQFEGFFGHHFFRKESFYI